MRTQAAHLRRSRPLRREDDSVLWFVTCRVIEERFVLHPILSAGLQPPNRHARRALEHLQQRRDKRLATVIKKGNARRGPFQPELTLADARRLAGGLVGAAAARAQQRCGAQVFALVVMSNHVHLLVRTRGKNLAAFMAYFKAAVTRDINHLTGRRGPLWARRYDAQPVLDDAAASDRVAYALDNPVKARLVEQPQDWPGLNLAYGMADADELAFEYLDRMAWHRKRRPADLSPFFNTTTLVLAPLPSCDRMTRELYAQSVQTWLQHARARRATERGDEPQHAVLGVEGIVNTDFFTRPTRPAFGRRPYAFGSPERRSEHRTAMIAVIAGHGAMSERYRAGDRMVVFPAGTYPPPVLQAA